MACVRMSAVAALVLMAVLTVHGVIDPNFDCPRNGQFAHPDCWKWYNCGEGIAHVMECQDTLLYEPSTVQCDYPSNVTCGDRNPNRPRPEETLKATLTVRAAGTIDPDFDCPRNGQFAHPDCWKWYNCGEGIAHVMECQDTLLYEPSTVQCDYPSNVTCGDRNPIRPPITEP